jgi:hypothetical protein
MRLIRSIPQTSFEAIDHQAGDFFEALTAIVSSGHGATFTGLKSRGIDKQLSACIKRFTNLTIQVRFMDSFESPGDAWIGIPATDMNHAILDDGARLFYQEYFSGKSLISEHSKKAGLLTRVDRVRGKVYGDYTNIVAELGIADEFFNSQYYEPEECAAVILHEVGHYFSYIEFLSCAITTNFVLSQLADGLSRATNPKERETYIVMAKDVLGSSANVNAEELSRASDPNAVEIVLVKDYIEMKRVEFGYDFFNQATWEAMADQFCSRQGAGRPLLTALDKIERRYGFDIAMRGKTAFYFAEVLKVIFTLSIVGTIVGLTMILCDSANFLYGRMPVRYERIRAELVDRLKDRKLDKAKQASITADIAVIDEIMKTVSDQRQWFSYIGAMLFTAKREYYKAEAVSRELEKLGANDFFVHSAKLRLLADTVKK